MSLPRVSSNKHKDLHDGVSSFERVSMLFKEIESFIENELAETPSISASYEIPRMKSKRKRGPYLIKPLNKSKARKTLNDMEYDPIRMEWVGNVSALKNFAGGRPALISNKANNFRPKSDGKMIWNSKEQKWEGNYDDLRAFEKRQLPLIKSIPSDSIPKAVNGMSFNPRTMTWEGNNDALLDFGTISEESSTPQDDGFAVGTEFQLTAAITQQFADCAAKHSASTSGWWRDEKTREHLVVIRTMSIMRLVRDAKRAAFALEEPSYMDIAVSENTGLKLKSPHAEPEVDFDDAWEKDIGPFTGTVKLKLPEPSSADIDLDLDQELSKFGSVSNKGGTIRITDEDWDDDFTDDLKKVLPRKLSTHKPIPSFDPITPPLPTVSNSNSNSNSSSSSSSSSILSSASSTSSASSSSSSSSSLPIGSGTITKLGKGGVVETKPFALLKADAPHRRSFYDLKIASPKLAWDEEEEDGLEIPAEPLRLKLNRVPSTNTPSSPSSSSTPNVITSEDEHEDDFDNVDEDYTPSVSEDVLDDGDVEEEDWNDVELPPTSLGEPVTRRVGIQQPPSYQAPEKEEWDDFEISAEKLETKLNQRKIQQQHHQHQITHKKHKGKAEEEEVDGLDIPDGFQLRLKR